MTLSLLVQRHYQGQQSNLATGAKGGRHFKAPANGRFTPKSGHWDSAVKCRLCANSGHWNSATKCPLSRREEQEEEDADVTDIIGGDIENKEEG
jgi:hypothetical protein